MGVNRSGYCKWRRRKGKPNRYEQDRILLTQMLEAEHKKYPSHGYHRLANDVFSETGWIFSHNLAHKRSTHQRFYVSSTTFNTDGYSPESMTPTLQKFGFDAENYKKHGLFVIRSTIMNPWYYRVQHSHSQVDYFSLFIEELHSAARQTIDEMTAGKRKKQTT